jgi:hypothetical protein
VDGLAKKRSKLLSGMKSWSSSQSLTHLAQLTKYRRREPIRLLKDDSIIALRLCSTQKNGENNTERMDSKKTLKIIFILPTDDLLEE